MAQRMIILDYGLDARIRGATRPEGRGRRQEKEEPMPLKKGNKLLPVVVSPEDKSAIDANAAAAGMSASQFLRTLGHEPTALVQDNADMMTLARIHGDQGRLGGLLKMWLADREKYNTTQEVTINKLMEDIAATQRKMLEAMDAILAKAKGRAK